MTMGYQCYLPRPPSPSHLLMLQIHISDSIWILGKQRSRNCSIPYPDHHWSSSTLQTFIAEFACTVASYMRSECWYLLATLLPNPLTYHSDIHWAVLRFLLDLYHVSLAYGC